MEEIKKILIELGKKLIWPHHYHPDGGDIVQLNTKDGISTLTDFVPKMTIAELIKCTGENGVGLGTLWSEKGKVTCEVTVVNGKAYISEGDFFDKGNTREAKPDEMVYFAQVGYFKPKIKSHKIDKNNDYIKHHLKFQGKITREILQDYIRDEIFQGDPEKAGAYVIKMDARLNYARLRTVVGTAEECDFDDGHCIAQNLTEIVDKQTEKEFSGKEFTISGVYNNTAVGEVSTDESFSGLHLHAIDEERKFGGHVNDFDLESCTIDIMPVKEWLVATREQGKKLKFREAHHPEPAKTIIAPRR